MNTSAKPVKQPKKEQEKPKVKRTVMQEILSWAGYFLCALVLATVIRTFVFEPVRVEGSSMTNTLADTEVMLVNKLPYLFGDVQRGDVVVCRYPAKSNTKQTVNLGAAMAVETYTLYVKRVVALPGDTVEIKEKKLYVNGEMVEDPEFMNSAPRADYGPRKLSRDEYFVMGDNRGNSHDSRASDVGPLSRSAIMGKVSAVLWPLNKIRGIE